MNLKWMVFTAVVAFVAAGFPGAGAHAQGFTFGPPAAADDGRVGLSGRAKRKAFAPARRCRLERHQVYDAQGQLILRTLRVCG
jgi:hypothetical protein